MRDRASGESRLRGKRAVELVVTVVGTLRRGRRSATDRHAARRQVSAWRPRTAGPARRRGARLLRPAGPTACTRSAPHGSNAPRSLTTPGDIVVLSGSGPGRLRTLGGRPDAAGSGTARPRGDLRPLGEDDRRERALGGGDRRRSTAAPDVVVVTSRWHAPRAGFLFRATLGPRARRRGGRQPARGCPYSRCFARP